MIALGLINNPLASMQVFHEFPRGEHVVAMRQYEGRLLVVTNRVVYENVDGGLVAVDLAQECVGVA